MSVDLGPAVNACSLCAPLGASLAFKGVRGCVPILHGSQGCATYIRRYTISHFREPVDIASSSFDEASVVFGGKADLLKAIRNVEARYRPSLIAIAGTCLSETIGDDVAAYIREFEASGSVHTPLLCVSAASYKATHTDGFRDASLALVKRFNPPGEKSRYKAPTGLNLFPGMASPEDLRHLKELSAAFGLETGVVPDYSDSLDGQAWGEYRTMTDGGTTMERLSACCVAKSSIEFFLPPRSGATPGSWLESEWSVPNKRLPFPLGINASDAFVDALAGISGRETPEAVLAERGRLVDAYIDSHKYLYGVKVAIAAREELAVALAAFCSELGMAPVVCAATGRSAGLADALKERGVDLEGAAVLDEPDHDTVRLAAEDAGAELFIGTGKLYPAARSLDAPLVRLDFPIHDRFGGQRILTAGYRGSQRLLDSIVNALLEKKQTESPIGYAYL
jgi:nitrogenase molybdenum-iron protein NifN